MNQILMIIAMQNFRDEELFDPKQIFESAGYKVTIASHHIGTAKGMLTHSAEAEKELKHVNIADYDAIIFVGGTGAVEFFDDEQAHKLAKDAVAKKKVLGAICIAPSILANAGLLKGKKATAWISEKKNIENHDGIFTNQTVCIDGNIVTANGPRAATEFGNAVIKVLKKS